MFNSIVLSLSKQKRLLIDGSQMEVYVPAKDTM